MKICLVASRGGHMEELACMSELDGEKFLITEKSSNTITFCDQVYYVEHINRKDKNAIRKIVKIFIEANAILKKEKPDCYISTGALIAVPVLILGKIRKKKIIYIETLARVEDLSLSGKIVYRFADVFCVYWESLLKKYPKARYIDLFNEVIK